MCLTARLSVTAPLPLSHPNTPPPAPSLPPPRLTLQEGRGWGSRAGGGEGGLVDGGGGRYKITEFEYSNNKRSVYRIESTELRYNRTLISCSSLDENVYVPSVFECLCT